MKKLFIDYLEQPVCPVSADRDPTPIEIQRWEDDGGATVPDAPPLRTVAELHEPVGDLAAAE